CSDISSIEFSTLSLHDALPIFWACSRVRAFSRRQTRGSYTIGWSVASYEFSLTPLGGRKGRDYPDKPTMAVVDMMMMATIDQSRSEEHTSELQSRENLVCRLLL